MENRRNLDYINDRAKLEQSGTDGGYLKAIHVNNNDRTDNGYVELGQMNNDNIGGSVKYDIIDYDLLNKKDPRQDQHTYRGLKFESKKGKNPDMTRPHHSNKVEIPVTSEQKKGGNRVFILIIVLLVALLVAMAATFGVLYTGGFFDKDGSSDAQLGGGTEKTSLSTPTAVTTTPITLTTTTAEILSIEERCQSYDGSIPHPSECQMYYNCSDTSTWTFLKECPYPELFNTETMTCENFESVDCGDREEAKDRCDYSSYQCSGRHCIPCIVRYPSCSGKADGFNVIDERLWTQEYILCHKERSVAWLSCPTDSVSSLSRLFSPEYNACVPLDRIPPEHGGYKPNCTGKADGSYPNNYGRCDYYIICSIGQYAYFGSCGDGTAFDEVTKTCTANPYTCECNKNC